VDTLQAALEARGATIWASNAIKFIAVYDYRLDSGKEIAFTVDLRDGRLTLSEEDSSAAAEIQRHYIQTSIAQAATRSGWQLIWDNAIETQGTLKMRRY